MALSIESRSAAFGVSKAVDLRIILIDAFLGNSKLSSARAASKISLLSTAARSNAAFSRIQMVRWPVSSSTLTCIQRREPSLVEICASLSGRKTLHLLICQKLVSSSIALTLVLVNNVWKSAQVVSIASMSAKLVLWSSPRLCSTVGGTASASSSSNSAALDSNSCPLVVSLARWQLKEKPEENDQVLASLSDFLPWIPKKATAQLFEAASSSSWKTAGGSPPILASAKIVTGKRQTLSLSFFLEPSIRVIVQRTRFWPVEVVPPFAIGVICRIKASASNCCSRPMPMDAATGMPGSGILGFPALTRTALNVVPVMDTTSVLGALLYCCFVLSVNTTLFIAKTRPGLNVFSKKRSFSAFIPLPWLSPRMYWEGSVVDTNMHWKLNEVRSSLPYRYLRLVALGLKITTSQNPIRALWAVRCDNGLNFFSEDCATLFSSFLDIAPKENKLELRAQWIPSSQCLLCSFSFCVACVVLLCIALIVLPCFCVVYIVLL